VSTIQSGNSALEHRIRNLRKANTEQSKKIILLTQKLANSDQAETLLKAQNDKIAELQEQHQNEL
jgi:ABC-type Fe3+-hydroxamate transport system substrate-binding protein